MYRSHFVAVVLVLIFAGGCSNSSDDSDEPAPSSSTVADTEQDPEDASTPRLELDEIGPSVALASTDSTGNSELQADTGLPEPFEVLASIFELEGYLAVGYSPFEPGGSTCVQGIIETDRNVPAVSTAGLTAGVDCASFSPFTTAADRGSLLECSKVIFLLTEWPIDALEAEGTSLQASVTTPAIPDGANWIAGTIDGPIPAADIPNVDIEGLDCITGSTLNLSADVPVLKDPVTQQLGVTEREDGGVQASFSSLGDGPAERTGEYVDSVSDWGEIVVDDGSRVELRHADGRYVTFVAQGGPGPMTFELCEWPDEPKDTTCS